jgi:hypothetical protein
MQDPGAERNSSAQETLDSKSLSVARVVDLYISYSSMGDV